jgi:plastocyanin
MAVCVVGLTGAGVLAATRLAGNARPAAGSQPDAKLAANCGELSRIRSVGAIGTQGADDAVNVLAYPTRAEVQVSGSVHAGAGVTLPALTPAALPRSASSAALAETSPATLVDECGVGWRVPGQVQLPVTAVLDTKRTGTYIQRIALWQDPTAARSSWAYEFEVLVSPSDTGDDFVPVLLDRPAQLKESVEPQWFSIMRPGINAAAPPFPDAVEMRRLMVRVLSTYGSPRQRAVTDGFSLGEVAAYGPDLEIVVQHPQSGGGEDTSHFQIVPAEVRALAGEPKFIFFLNHTKTALTHDIVTVNQQTNMEVKLAPGEAKAGQLIAGRPGRYEFYCKVVGHAEAGLIGTIIVR